MEDLRHIVNCNTGSHLIAMLENFIATRMVACSSEQEELDFFSEMLGEGALASAALEAARTCDQAMQRVTERSYCEGDILTRVILQQGEDFELRLHSWNSLSADESVWHGHQYPIVVRCLAGGYEQELGVALENPEGEFRVFGRRSKPNGGGFETYPLEGQCARSVIAEKHHVTAGTQYAMSTSQLHRLQEVSSDSHTLTLVMRGSKREKNPLFLASLTNGAGQDAIDRVRSDVSPSVVKAIVKEALGQVRQNVK